jgi:hypothetical protein
MNHGVSDQGICILNGSGIMTSKIIAALVKEVSGPWLVKAKSLTLIKLCDHSVEAEELNPEALGYFPRRRSSSLVVRCDERVYGAIPLRFGRAHRRTMLQHRQDQRPSPNC